MDILQENSLYSYLKQIKCHFFCFVLQNQITGEQNRSYLEELVPVGVGKRWGKSVGERIW
jgi:hypothetical protein